MAFMILMALLLPLAIMPEFGTEVEDEWEGAEDEQDNVLRPNIMDDLFTVEGDDEEVLFPQIEDDGPVNWPDWETAIAPSPDTPDVLHEMRSMGGPVNVFHGADAAPDNSDADQSERATSDDPNEISSVTEEAQTAETEVSTDTEGKETAEHSRVAETEHSDRMQGQEEATEKDAVPDQEQSSQGDETFQTSSSNAQEGNEVEAVQPPTDDVDEYEEIDRNDDEVQQREDGVWVVSPFDADTDKFEVNLQKSQNSHHTEITVEPSSNGEDSEIYIKSELYAILKGAPHADENNIFITRN